MPLAAGPYFLVIAAMLTAQFFGDIGWEIYSINEITLRQMVVPGRLMGRANATMQFLTGGAGPVGALVAGALAQAASAAVVSSGSRVGDAGRDSVPDLLAVAAVSAGRKHKR